MFMLFGVRTESALLILVLFAFDGMITVIVKTFRPAAVPVNHIRREFLRIVVFIAALIVLNAASNGDPFLSWLGPISFTWMTIAEILYIFKGLAFLDKRVLFLLHALKTMLRRNADADLKEYVGVIDNEDSTKTMDQADRHRDPFDPHAD